jgi:hypothetical protein
MTGDVGKRSSTGRTPAFDRRALDAYSTPFEAVPPLLPFLDGFTTYAEPCCGEGRLIEHLAQLKPELRCIWKTDISDGLDALEISEMPAQLVITNPPWERDSLHALIHHLAYLKPTWLLFDADWMHTKQAALTLPLCSHIVSVGRVKWIAGSPSVSKDNVAWYRFHDALPI